MPEKTFPNDLDAISLADGDLILLADASDSSKVKKITAAGMVTYLDGKYLNKANSSEFNPSSNYHPATVKYVNDAIEAIKKNITFVISNPSSADAFMLLHALDSKGITITSVWALCDGGASVEIKLQEADTDGANPSDICSATTITTSKTALSLSDAGIAAGKSLKYVSSALSGAVDRLYIHVEYTVDA